MSVHIEVDGAYAVCEQEECPLPFHLPFATVAEFEATPLELLLPLFEVVDPPSRVTEVSKIWHDEYGNKHRDYDLPAEVEADGILSWRRHGRRHRGHDRPAVIWSDGTRVWYSEGSGIHREGDKPARISADGRQEWFYNNDLHRVGGPAIIFEDGSMEWWEHGNFIRFEDAP